MSLVYKIRFVCFKIRKSRPICGGAIFLAGGAVAPPRLPLSPPLTNCTCHELYGHEMYLFHNGIHIPQFIYNIYIYSTRPKVFEQIEFVTQVAHDRDTYATSNISP